MGLLLLVLAGCGSGIDGDQGAPGPSSEPNEQEAALEYSRCMRENGVPDFPDPEPGENGEARLSTPEGADKEAMDAANAECKRLLPNGGEPREMDPEDIVKQRAFARCMRENGLPDFPDPKPDGGIAVEGGPNLDPLSEEFKAAEQKCAKHLPDGGRGATTDHEDGE
ncbi:hypothetical protein BU204_09565 [Actinophytocola xanthii]|uniref:Uncharacterized protein n=1 Tax=Actinophytocola xanthii TaxID=1912961 RepID=A0A1Q8CU01_9PSEU|nr:hypothetical protein BU204_09565 [Actinophytocola xanthii]